MVGLVGTIYIVTIAYYAIPALAAKGHGTLRYHLNIFPFVMVLAGVIVFSSMNRVRDGWGQRYLFVGLVALLVDVFLFVGHAFPVEFGWFAVHSKVINDELPCSNRVVVRFLDNMWPVLPILNLLWLAIFFAAGAASVKRLWLRIGLLTLAWVGLLALPLLNISIHNELKHQQSGWQLLSRTTFFWDSYQNRRAEIDRLIGGQDPNYRMLPCSANVFRMGRGRNWKLLADTELGAEKREKILFSYRETMHPYTALLYSTFDTQFISSNWFPPLSDRVAANMPILKLMGVRWVLSADAPINSPSLTLRGTWRSPPCPFYETAADGTVFIYEVHNPLPVAFQVGRYKVVNRYRQLRELWVKQESPWLRDTVWLEREPANVPGPAPGSVQSAIAPVRIIAETFTRVQIQAESAKSGYLVLSYLHRPFWKAHVNGTEQTIYRAYGGFMSVPVPKGETTVVFKYTPWDVYAGLFGSALAFVLPLSFGWWQRRHHFQEQFSRARRIGMRVGGVMVVIAIGYWVMKRTYPESWVKQGEDLVGAGRYGAASDCFLKALAKGGQSAVVYRRLSECFEALEQWDRAMRYGSEWTRMEPDNPRAWLTLGRICYEAGRYDLAVEVFSEADRKGPDCAEACKGWAMSEYARRRYVAALPLFRRWIKLATEDDEAQQMMRLMLARMGHDVPEAISHLTAALQSGQLKQGDQVECLAMLGVSESRLGNIAQAQHCFEQAEQLDHGWMRLLTVEEQRMAWAVIAAGTDTIRRQAMASALFSLNRNNVTSAITYAKTSISEFAASETSPAALVELSEVRRTRLSLPPSSISLTTGTFAVWARLANVSQPYSTLLAINDTTPLYVYRRGEDGTFVLKYNGNSTTFTPPSTAILGITNWHHYVATWADGEQRLLIDGVLACSMNERAATGRVERVCAGWNGINDNEQWNGLIWNCVTFARALETREIAALIRADILDAVSAADAAWNTGEYDRAGDVYQRAANFHQGNPDLSLKMATYYDRIGRRTEAVKWYEQWASGAHDNIEGLMTLGSVYLGVKNYPKAFSTFERLLKIEPGNMAFIRGAGISAFGWGVYSKAADLLRVWAEAEPKSFAANWLAGKAVERSAKMGFPARPGVGAVAHRDYLKDAVSLANRRFVLDLTSVSRSNNAYCATTPEGWKVTMSGPVAFLKLPGRNNQALRIHDAPKATRIYGPVEMVNLGQGTISVWARLKDPSKRYADIVAVYSATSGARCLYLYRASDGRIKMRYNENTDELASRSGVVTDGNWHHYAITWRDGEQAVYVDGEQVLSGYARAPAGKTSRLAIGWLGDGDTEQWNGWLAEFSVFGKILSAEDVATLAFADAADYQRANPCREP